MLRHALLNAHYRSPIDLTEQLLEDAKGHHAKLVEAYGHALVITEQAKKAGMQEAPCLPQADVASPDFLSSKLGLLENSCKKQRLQWMMISTVAKHWPKSAMEPA